VPARANHTPANETHPSRAPRNANTELRVPAGPAGENLLIMNPMIVLRLTFRDC
jgi:hypothetical protein